MKEIILTISEKVREFKRSILCKENGDLKNSSKVVGSR